MFQKTERGESAYLGDGVYATKLEDGMLVLTTSCHYGCQEQEPDNVICLEPEVLSCLKKCLDYLQ
jgi:hypothetical protein